MKVLEVSARKGGVGTSTVAVALAVSLAKARPNGVLLVDSSEYGDSFSILGASVPAGYGSHSVCGEYGLTVAWSTPDALRKVAPNDIFSYDFVVIDAGLATHDGDYFGETPFRISVVANSYLSLRAQTMAKVRPNAFVSLHNDENVLTTSDTANVLNGYGAPLHVFPVNSAVSRAIDAGLFASRTALYEKLTDEILTDYDLLTRAKASS